MAYLPKDEVQESDFESFVRKKSAQPRRPESKQPIKRFQISES